MAGRNTFEFIKNNPSILYTLLLIIVLPLSIWFTTFYAINSFEKNIDLITQEKALAIENVISDDIKETIKDNNTDELRLKIERIARENPEISNLEVISFSEGKFKIIASKKKSSIGKNISDPSYNLAWYQKQNIAYLSGTPKERFWKLVKPVGKSQTGSGFLLSLSLSLNRSDTLTERIAKTAYFIIVALIILVLLLVVQHARLFQYAEFYKKLKKIDEAKNSFFRMAIHELQTPIVNIRGYIELLKDKMGDSLGDEEKESLSRISISAKNLSDLMYDVLEVVKIEQGALDFSLEKIEPPKIIREALETFKWKAKNKGLEVEYQSNCGQWKILANKNRFREIVVNLLENALKYTKEGKIKLNDWIDEKKKVYYLTIEDTGIGISGEEQKNLFTKFYRVRNKETADIRGTGLGLWITKSACQKMKGGIVLESIKGIGSKFTVYFKAIKEK